MRIEINTAQMSDKFTDIEKLAILAHLIETCNRYDYESIARHLNMPGRTIFAGRGSWRTRGMMMDWILLSQDEFTDIYNNNYNRVNDADIRVLEKKRRLLEQTTINIGFNTWASEFIKIYSITWFMQRVSVVLEKTRQMGDHENLQYNLNLSMEVVR